MAEPPPEGEAIGFLVSQIGRHSTRRLTGRLEPLGLEPKQLGVLRLVAAFEGSSQHDLAKTIQVAPSRMVAIVDELSERGLVERRADPDDRRVRALYLTAKGRRLASRASAVATEHERELSAGLDRGEREQLRELLTKLAATLDISSAPVARSG